MLEAARRWGRFVRERFPPASHLPMVAVVTLANAAFAGRAEEMPVRPLRLLTTFTVTLLFFFRLRCFDEIKDLEVDLRLNPSRPLARGLLSVRQVLRAIALLAAVELVLCGWLGSRAVLVHAGASAYSFLMYKEFFIGRILRPLLTTYAVAHTFVSILLGWSIAAQTTGRAWHEMAWPVLLLGPVNWALFNVFEFGRKTFSPDEERAGADSYSSLFGPAGAAALTLGQIALAMALLAALPGQVLSAPAAWPSRAWTLHLPLAAIVIAAAAAYVLSPRRAARVYRSIVGGYLIAFYAVLAWQSLA